MENKINENIENQQTLEPAADSQVANAVEEPAIVEGIRQPYVPCFTEASDNYRAQNDKKIREQLGIASEEVVAEKVDFTDPDVLNFDSTAEFEEDIIAAPAKAPENVAREVSDESISIYKFETPDEVPDEEAEKELERINELLYADGKPAEPEQVEPVEEEVEDAPAEEDEMYEDAPEAQSEVEADLDGMIMPNLDGDDFGVYDYAPRVNEPEIDEPEGIDEEYKYVRNEYTNPAEYEKHKDKFLDSLLSKKIRIGFSAVFALALLVLEILSATGVVGFDLFAKNDSSALGIVDFLLAAGIFILALPETFRAFKYLFKGKLLVDIVPTVSFILLGVYVLAVALTGITSYALFGFLFAVITIPVMNASIYRKKGDFIGFKMISRNEEKQIIDQKNTRDLGAENMALDGYVDEYKSKSARTFCAEFISGFFTNSALEPVSTKENAITLGIPFAIAFISAVVTYFLASGPSIVMALGVFALVFMLGCPAFSALASKLAFFHAQRAAIQCDSTAVGEAAYDDFSSVDVITFNDTDIFGPDDVNLKRFILYCDRENMDKVMSQMCALFAAVGGPLDFIFSNIIDNRMRHKTATNLIIEDDGLCGEVAGHRIFAGSEEYMRRNNIAIPATAIGAETNVGIDTTKVMYAAEDGEVNAKFYIRYSFSEEFTMILSELRDAEIIPLIYTRDPNISNELLRTLTASGSDCMRICKVYTPITEEKLYNRVDATMITYGDKIDAASMVLLARRYKDFTLRVKFTELCAMILGILMAIVFSIVGASVTTSIIAAFWQIIPCMLLRMISYRVFLNQNRETEE